MVHEHANPLDGNGRREVGGDSKPESQARFAPARRIGETFAEKCEQLVAQTRTVVRGREANECAKEQRDARHRGHAIRPSAAR
jgi:hypothetical protein